jgi:DNA-binding LytR/AlgR family response regulator
MNAAGGVLRGWRILVVEDDYLIAADLEASLAEVGAMVVGPASSISDALQIIASSDRLDAAVLDVNIRGERVYAVADALRERGVPFVFATGYDVGVLPARYADVPRCDKPLDLSRLLPALMSLRAEPAESTQRPDLDGNWGDRR